MYINFHHQCHIYKAKKRATQKKEHANRVIMRVRQPFGRIIKSCYFIISNVNMIYIMFAMYKYPIHWICFIYTNFHGVKLYYRQVFLPFQPYQYDFLEIVFFDLL